MTSSSSKSVTAVLVNYNYSQYVRGRLREVVDQSYKVDEIIFLDDASTDDSVEVAESEIREIQKSDPSVKIRLIRNKKNSGSVFSQWQRGIKEAKSDYVWIVEMDDSCDNDFLETAMRPVLDDDSIAISYTASKLIGSVGIKDRARLVKDFFRRRHCVGDYVVDGKEELNRNLAVYDSIPNVSACVIKKVDELDAILDEAKTYKLSGDWYTYIKLAESGKIAYSSKRKNYHRLSESSVTGKTKLSERYKEMQKIHSYVKTRPFISDKTKKRIAILEEQLAKAWNC